jgi:hypothetical protein
MTITDRIRSAASESIATAAWAALALIGAVWLSIAAVSALAQATSPVAAQALIGAALIAPLLVVTLRAKLSKPAQPQPQAFASSEQDVALLHLARTAERLAEKSPLASAGLALAAGLLASRAPTVLPIILHVLTMALDRWSAQRPEGPPQA